MQNKISNQKAWLLIARARDGIRPVHTNGKFRYLLGHYVGLDNDLSLLYDDWMISWPQWRQMHSQLVALFPDKQWLDYVHWPNTRAGDDKRAALARKLAEECAVEERPH